MPGSLSRPLPKLLQTASLAAGLVLCADLGIARAQSCDDEVTRLAGRFNIGLDAGAAIGPTGEAKVPPAPPATLESRGVIETQPVPPSAGAAVAPHAGAEPVPPADAMLDPARRQRMTEHLAAARAASRRGDTALCVDQLRAAQQIPGVPGALRPQ